MLRGLCVAVARARAAAEVARPTPGRAVGGYAAGSGGRTAGSKPGGRIPRRLTSAGKLCMPASGVTWVHTSKVGVA